MLRLLVFLALCGTAAARAETRPPYGGTAVGSLLGAPVDLDPVRAHTHAEVTLVTLVFDTLYQVSPQANVQANPQASDSERLVPHLAAARPMVSADGLEVRIPLRPGVVFHDGSALGADDVAASLRRLADSPAGWLLAPVREIDSISASASTGASAGAGISAGAGADVRSGGQIVLRLTRPMPDIGLVLSAPATSITPRGRPPRGDAPVGSGPFVLRRLDRARARVLLEAAPAHFAGRPYLNGLELRWFERADQEATAYEIGTLHLSLRGAVAYVGHTPKYHTREVTGPATVLAYAGAGSRGAFHGVQARQALSLALERESFRGIGTGERVVPTLYPAPVALDGPATPASDRRAHLDRARRALDAARQSDAGLRTRLARGQELELIVDRSRPDDREIAENVAAALFRLGVGARIVELDAPAFAARVRRGDCDLYIGQMVLPAPSAALAFAAAFAAGGDGWARARLARGALDIEAARRTFAQNLPIVPLFHRAVRVHHRHDLRGVTLDHASRLSLADAFFFGQPALSR